MKKYLFIFLLSGLCIADMVILKNGQSFDGLLVGMKENNILFKDNYNKIIYLRTETIEYLSLSNGEIIIKDDYFNVSNDKKIEAAITLGNIISEALTKIQISCYIEKDYIKLNNEDSYANYNTLFHNFDKYKNNIEKSLNSCILKMINKIKKN